jgi:hypothetical protein
MTVYGYRYDGSLYGADLPDADEGYVIYSDDYVCRAQTPGMDRS